MVGRAEKEKREALLSFYVLAVVGCGVGGANREPDIHATRMWRRHVFGFRLWDSIHDRRRRQHSRTSVATKVIIFIQSALGQLIR